jgi:hypothetical protein
MTAENRAALHQALSDLWNRYPDWRFGQLVSNVAGWADADIWDVEDDPLLAALRSHLEERARQDQGSEALTAVGHTTTSCS